MPLDLICPSGHSFTLPELPESDSTSCPSCGQAVKLTERIAETHDWAPPSDRLVTPKPAFEKGRKLGRFELLERVGQGASGIVWRAYDPSLDREVALKLPRGGLLDSDEDVAAFLREGLAAGKLRHAHIVPVYEAGKADGYCFLASAFIEGMTLKLAIEQRSRFAAREAAKLVLCLAEALHYAHGRGVIHRDVKPGNIMLDAAGEPQIMDFGLAHRGVGETLLSHEGACIGTPAYMSPEQASGRSQEVDGRSDLWSLGVVLYELLTGQRPFSGKVAEAMAAIQQHDPISPRRIVSSLPPDLETICLKCLSKSPTDRYADCKALADDLGRFLRHEPILARPATRLERAARWCKRNPALAATAALAALALFAGTVVFVASWGIVRATRSDKDLAVQQAKEQRIAAKSAKQSEALALSQKALAAKAANYNAYLSGIAEVERSLKLSNMQGARDVLESCPPELRGWEWSYLRQIAAESARVIEIPDPEQLAISPDGLVIATGGDDSIVRLHDLNTGELLVSLPPPPVGTLVEGLVFSPNSQRLAVLHLLLDGMAIQIVDVPGRKVLATIELERGVIASPSQMSLNSDGTRLAIVSGSVAVKDVSVRVFDTDSTAQVLAVPITRIGLLFFEPSITFGQVSNTLAISGSPTGSILIYDVGKRSAVKTLRPDPEGPLQQGLGEAFGTLRFADDDQILLAVRNGQIHRWNTSTWEPQPDFEHINLGIAGRDDFVLSANGLRAANCSGTAVYFWDLTSPPLPNPVRPAYRVEPDPPMALSPDGSWFAARDRDRPSLIAVVDTTTGNTVTTLAGHSSEVTRLAFGARPNRLVSVANDGSLRIWTVSPGEGSSNQAARQLKMNGAVSALAFNPGGQRLAVACERVLRMDFSRMPTHLRPRPKIGAEGRSVPGSMDNPLALAVFDAETGELVRQLDGHEHKDEQSRDKSVDHYFNHISSVAWTTAGQLASIGNRGQHPLSGSGDQMGIWDVATGQARFRQDLDETLSTEGIASAPGCLIAGSHGGRLLARTSHRAGGF